jgi:hypothetical protein
MKKTTDNVYAVIIEAGDATFLSLQLASSLEEAFAMARMEFARSTTMVSKGNTPLRAITGAKIGLFTIKSFSELTREATEFREVNKRVMAPEAAETPMQEPVLPSLQPAETKQESPTVETEQQKKNALMKKILNTNDVKMFLENKKQFTKNEKAYIKAQLIKKGKT